ncbi:thiamine phosphate synthase [Edaphobacter modestus]|uniref:Thiamine-phosphate synthase n=1 Tax=Edaphobacter modestus TaxID=388466 RepID=A0A4Q7YQL2_9BACT|nr:thiamine phosphate synthase [Edaphobacter modestus]RZU39055.1 thiamine-phosphate diphosphorylase [Edaphobacter modestus]
MGQTDRGQLPPRTLRLPRLYPIVDAETLTSRGVALRRFVEELRDGGVTLVQYRDKVGGEEEILRHARTISDIFQGRKATLVMNDSPRLAGLVGWNAVHVGQGDVALGEARAAVPGDAIVGCSTHTEEQVRIADAAGADYIAIGPVFATSSKRNPDPVVGLDGVRRARSLTQRPLVAIGGITLENAASVIEAGADSVAVIGALLEPGEAAGMLVRRFLSAMPPVGP